MMHDNFKQLKNILNNILKKYDLDSFIEIDRMIINWNDIVGKKLSKICKPKDILNGTLTIEVKDALWRNELAKNKGQMLNLINKNLGKKTVKKIIFK